MEHALTRAKNELLYALRQSEEQPNLRASGEIESRHRLRNEGGLTWNPADGNGTTTEIKKLAGGSQ